MRITSKGQVTIPQEIREQCGLLPHTQVRFVDSNVILDVITADPRWQAWSEQQLSRWLDRGPLLINPIVYAEIAFACEAIETVDELLPVHLYAYRPIPREAGAGHACNPSVRSASDCGRYPAFSMAWRASRDSEGAMATFSTCQSANRGKALRTGRTSAHG
jgi:hypothetical protein